MSILPVLVICSLALAAVGVLLFLYSIRQGDHEHADRLALLPLEGDDGHAEGRRAPRGSETRKKGNTEAKEPTEQPRCPPPLLRLFRAAVLPCFGAAPQGPGPWVPLQTSDPNLSLIHI